MSLVSSKWVLKICGAALACLMAVAPPVLSREAEEYKVKAAFVYNFIKFIQWPETAFKGTDTPFLIYVMGTPDALGQFKVINGKKNRNRTILIRSSAENGGGIPDYHVLFISRGVTPKDVQKAIRSTGEKPILIIGEERGFIQLGGSINFFFKDDRLQFEINPHAAAARQLEISSRLLKLAVIVEER